MTEKQEMMKILYAKTKANHVNKKIEVPTTIKFTSPDIEKLESMVRRAVESWGDYSPTPQSKAGRVLKEMRDYLLDVDNFRKGVGTKVHD